MTALTDILPAQVRRILYAVYALIGLALGAVQVGYSAGALGQPSWLIVTWAVFGFVGTGLGLTAASNITTPQVRDDATVAAALAARNATAPGSPERVAADRLLTQLDI